MAREVKSAFTPYLITKDAEQAVAFYAAAFGAEERYRLTDPQTGKIGHADIAIGEATIMLASRKSLQRRCRPAMAKPSELLPGIRSGRSLVGVRAASEQANLETALSPACLISHALKIFGAMAVEWRARRR